MERLRRLSCEWKTGRRKVFHSRKKKYPAKRHKVPGSFHSQFTEFIHSCPTFSSMKIFPPPFHHEVQAQGMEEKSLAFLFMGTNETFFISLLSYFRLRLLLPSRSCTHSQAMGQVLSFPSPMVLYGCCFSFSFSKPELSLRKSAFHFLFFFRSKNWKHF